MFQEEFGNIEVLEQSYLWDQDQAREVKKGENQGNILQQSRVSFRPSQARPSLVDKMQSSIID